jgi:hypothetical protein
MDRLSKGFSWIWIFSTLLMGCYVPVVIDPNGKEGKELPGIEIWYVVTKDGKRIDFVEPPKVDGGSRMIVGQIVVTTQGSDTQKVSISLAAVARTGKTESGTSTYLIDVSGKKYVFVEPPSLIDDTIIGRVEISHTEEAEWKTVSIPLTDVVELHGFKPDPGAPAAFGKLLAIPVVIGICVAMIAGSNGFWH